MRMFTLNNAGLIPGVEYSKHSYYDVYGVKIGIRLDGKCGSALAASSKLVDKYPDGIIQRANITDRDRSVLVTERQKDSDTVLVLLSVGRGIKPVEYLLNTLTKDHVPLAQHTSDKVLQHDHSEYLRGNSESVGFTEEAILLLSKGESLLVRPENETHQVLCVLPDGKLSYTPVWQNHGISQKYYGTSLTRV